jgi:hypothetical protein
MTFGTWILMLPRLGYFHMGVEPTLELWPYFLIAVSIIGLLLLILHR